MVNPKFKVTFCIGCSFAKHNDVKQNIIKCFQPCKRRSKEFKEDLFTLPEEYESKFLDLVGANDYVIDQDETEDDPGPE